MSITEAIELLKNYNGPLELTLHKGASEEFISKVERTYDISLPTDFKTLYRFTDGFETVEDIFNMIPLTEIMGIKKYNEPLWIAEYMIYCDMWGLEANRNNPDDYSIFSIDGYGDKIILTNYLAEFISRFLKGGVFDFGGLYAWADEIKAKLYGNTDPDKIKPLLWVYRECLKRGIMTKEDVVYRADWIVATEEHPHDFFIEMSLSRDLNKLITVLDSMYLSDNVLQKRAFLGQLSTKLLIDKISVADVISVLEDYWSDENFTLYERDKMTGLIYATDHLRDSMPNAKLLQQLHKETKIFIDNYSKFNFSYVKNWGKIDADLVKTFENNQVH